MNTKNCIFIIRGLPGSGKSELGLAIADITISEDDFHHRMGTYHFDPTMRHEAIGWMIDRAVFEMDSGTKRIAVATCAMTLEELAAIRMNATESGYQLFSILVQNDHGGKSIHDVKPEDYKWMAAHMDNTLDYRVTEQ